MTMFPKPEPRQPSPRKQIPRGKPPRKFNKLRQAREMIRKYGTSHRRHFIRRLPCSSCGIEGYSQNAHVLKVNGGMGRKGDASGVAPLCGPRYADVGCHALWDRHRDKFAARFPWYDPAVICETTERAYQAYCEAEQEMSA